jgi:hypothetical protein
MLGQAGKVSHAFGSTVGCRFLDAKHCAGLICGFG